MRQYLLLLRPSFLATRNQAARASRGDRLKTSGLTLLGLAIWGLIFYATSWFLRYFRGFEVIGEYLPGKLLSIIFLTFFAILIISNIITALSTFYLSDELELLNNAPISPISLFFARLTESVLESSWMVVFFGFPIFLAYGVTHEAPAFYYLWFLLVLVSFLLIPAGIGALLTLVLVNVFPARKTREILILLGIIVIAFLYILFRVIRPEQLVNPEALISFASAITYIKVPSSGYLPSIWATNAILPALKGIPDKNGILSFLLLFLTGSSLVIIVEWLHRAFYPRGFSRSQEAKRSGYFRRTPLDVLLGFLTTPLSPPTRAMVAKEVKFFFRDTTQWSQLFLLAALVAVYLFNFRAINFERAGWGSFYLQNLYSFMNLGIAGFVLAALCARFAFPLVSLEGKAFWLIRSSPLTAHRVIWSKFFVMIIPIIFLAEILIIFSNRMLQVTPFMEYLSAITIFFMTFGIVGLAVGLGAIYPRFHIENPAKIAAGFGGIAYMFLSMAFIGLVVILEARPVYVFFMSNFRDIPISAGQWIELSLYFALVLGLNLIAFLLPLQIGIRRLETVPIP